jgi:CubicO group peptidase (beta-lactamase class C family)
MQKLDFDPGERYAYCNYGCILLVRVIEKVSGQSFIDYLQATVCKTAQAPSFSLSSSDARERQPGEIWYCYHPEYPQKMVHPGSGCIHRYGCSCHFSQACRFAHGGETTRKRQLRMPHSEFAPWRKRVIWSAVAQ